MCKKAFVTGATGFIGINLVKLLIKEGWHVTALHRSSSKLSELKKYPVDLVEGSVTKPRSLQNKIPENAEVLFHLAADTSVWSRYNERQTNVNVVGTQNMIRAATQKGINTFIYTSSVSAWGHNISGTITEETTQKGNESWVNYERSKWAGEREALKGLEQGMKVVILNPSTVIGPHDANNWGRLFFALHDGSMPGIIPGNISVAHVEHVAQAHLSAVENGRSGDRYILGGDHCKFSDFITTMCRVADISKVPPTIPVPLLKLAARFAVVKAYITGNEHDLTPELAAMLTREACYSSQKAKRELGYTIPSMQTSVTDCYRWLKEKQLL